MIFFIRKMFNIFIIFTFIWISFTACDMVYCLFARWHHSSNYMQYTPYVHTSSVYQSRTLASICTGECDKSSYSSSALFRFSFTQSSFYIFFFVLIFSFLYHYFQPAWSVIRDIINEMHLKKKTRKLKMFFHVWRKMREDGDRQKKKKKWYKK